MKIKKDFENFKMKHASLKKELFVTPRKESPTINVPKPSKIEDIYGHVNTTTKMGLYSVFFFALASALRALL